MAKKSTPDLRDELDGLEVDLRTRRLVSEKLDELDEILPGWVITLMPPEAKGIIEELAAKRKVSAPIYISEAVGYVTGLHSQGIWIGDLVKRSIKEAVIEELKDRAKNAGQRGPNGKSNHNGFH